MLEARSVVARSEVLAAELAGSSFPVARAGGRRKHGRSATRGCPPGGPPGQRDRRRAPDGSRRRERCSAASRCSARAACLPPARWSRRGLRPRTSVSSSERSSARTAPQPTALRSRGRFRSRATRSQSASNGPARRTRSCGSRLAPPARRRRSSGIRASRARLEPLASVGRVDGKPPAGAGRVRPGRARAGAARARRRRARPDRGELHPRPATGRRSRARVSDGDEPVGGGARPARHVCRPGSPGSARRRAGARDVARAGTLGGVAGRRRPGDGRAFARPHAGDRRRAGVRAAGLGTRGGVPAPGNETEA